MFATAKALTATKTLSVMERLASILFRDKLWKAFINSVDKRFYDQYPRTVETWEISSSQKTSMFSQKRQKGGNTWTVTIWSTDKIWNYLNAGTSKRYALMHQEFDAKTTVRTIDSQEGSHPYPLFRGAGIYKKINRPPEDGIEARDWHGTIMDEGEDEFFEDQHGLFKRIRG